MCEIFQDLPIATKRRIGPAQYSIVRPQSMRLIKGVGGWEKLNTRGAMRIIIKGGEMRNASASANANVDAMPSCTRLSPPFQSSFSSSPTSVYTSQLGVLQVATHSAMFECQLSSASASLSSLSDFLSVKLTSSFPLLEIIS